MPTSMWVLPSFVKVKIVYNSKLYALYCFEMIETWIKMAHAKLALLNYRSPNRKKISCIFLSHKIFPILKKSAPIPKRRNNEINLIYQFPQVMEILTLWGMTKKKKKKNAQNTICSILLPPPNFLQAKLKIWKLISNPIKRLII